MLQHDSEFTMTPDGQNRLHMRHGTRRLIAFCLLSIVGGFGLASEAQDTATLTSAPIIEVTDAWAPEPAGTASAAVYLGLHNLGGVDRLISVRSTVSEDAMIHQTQNDQGMMSMRHHDHGILLSSEAELDFQPGGWHIMLTGMTVPLEAGDEFSLTLVFEKAGEVTVPVIVKPRY